ncbi:MAG: pyrroline-5-carboxylate reductase [Planctomycetales bacterium]
MGEATTAPRIGFLGSGKMAIALAGGFASKGVVPAQQIQACDVVPQAREAFTKETGIKATDQLRAVVDNSDILFIAVKPQSMQQLLKDLAPLVTTKHLVVSIAAGIPLATLSQALGADRRIIRVMPNTPCLVGASASGYSVGGKVTAADADMVQKLLSAVGIAVEVPESLLDTVTGLSGSGPAFVYLMIEALSDGGVRMGLPRNVATTLAAQTLLGAAKMVLETGIHPGALKDAVASPGGTTIAGLQALEVGGLRGCLMNAVEAATLRARELGKLS